MALNFRNHKIRVIKSGKNEVKGMRYTYGRKKLELFIGYVFFQAIKSQKCKCIDQSKCVFLNFLLLLALYLKPALWGAGIVGTILMGLTNTLL